MPLRKHSAVRIERSPKIRGRQRIYVAQARECAHTHVYSFAFASAYVHVDMNV